MDINQDLLERIRKIADDEGISFKEALNRAITRGLNLSVVAERVPFVIPTFSIGLDQFYDLRNIRHQLDEEDDMRLLERMRRREDVHEDS